MSQYEKGFEDGYAVARRNYDKKRKVIYWLKDWWAEGCPYGIEGIIKKIKKI